MINVLNESLEVWLGELRPYQRSSISQMLQDSTPDEAIERWLRSIGSENISPFGGEKYKMDAKPYLDKLKFEFRKFICDENAYTEQKALKAETLRTLLVSAISEHWLLHLAPPGQ